MDVENIMENVKTFTAVRSNENGEVEDDLPEEVVSFDVVRELVEDLVHRYNRAVRIGRDSLNQLGCTYGLEVRNLKHALCKARASNAHNEMLLAERRSSGGALTAGSCGQISFWFKVAEYWRQKDKEKP